MEKCTLWDGGWVHYQHTLSDSITMVIVIVYGIDSGNLILIAILLIEFVKNGRWGPVDVQLVSAHRCGVVERGHCLEVVNRVRLGKEVGQVVRARSPYHFEVPHGYAVA